MPDLSSAQTHVQRALHSLMLEDERSAKVYLLRALSSLKREQWEEQKQVGIEGMH